MDGWQIVAALATSISALVIAWQANETRKSAKASRETLGVAEQSLELAREEAGRSTAMVAESVKARLDVGAPHISFDKAHTTDEEREFVEWDSQQPESGLEPFKRRFHVPQEDGRSVWLKVQITVENHGSSSVSLNCSHPVFRVDNNGRWEEPRATVRVPDGKRIKCGVLIGGTLSSWVGATEQVHKEDGFRQAFQFVSELQSNSGVVNIQRIEVQRQTARKLSEGQWTLTNDPNVALLPLRKVYVLDSSKGLEISDAPAALYSD